MLAASIHEHAGLGNQLWRYVCCRVFAENHGYEFGVSHPGWRGKFLNIDWGRDCLLYTSPSPRDPKTSRMPSSA